MSDARDLAQKAAVLAPKANVFPQVEITTQRLLLRAYTEADTEDNAAMHDNEFASRWSDMPSPYTLDHSREWCTRIAIDIRTSGYGVMWAVADRVSGRLLGCTGLHRTDWRNRVTDVSATGAPWAVGHGYAKEALRAISRWALTDLQFNRLQIIAAIDNRPPQRVAAACGFMREGVLRNAGSSRFGQVDMIIYSLVPSDLEKTGSRDEEMPCRIGTA